MGRIAGEIEYVADGGYAQRRPRPAAAENRRPIASSIVIEEAVGQLAQESVADDQVWHDGQTLRQLMSQLPPEQCQLIEMAFFLGMTHSELADELDMPLGTVKKRLRRGLQRLREMWKESA